ncbi:membrane protein, partial [Stutzerimonas stutzeri]
FNTRHNSNCFAWALPAAALGMICLAYVTAPNRQPAPNLAATSPEQASTSAQQSGASQFAQVSEVIHERCTVCHSAQPSSPLFSAAPAGVMFDTAEQIREQAAKIHAQTVASQIMPLGNITQMTQDERDLLGDWIAKGASID